MAERAQHAAGVADPPAVDRRGFLGLASGVGVVASLAGAYGTLAAFMGRYLFPSGPPDRAWLYVCDLGQLQLGEALLYRTPAGATVNVTRTAAGSDTNSFLALSSTCPHLGCQVHWEAQNNRFFCPCHGGVFEPTGKAIAGPPAQAGQALLQFPLKVQSGLLFIEVDTAEAALGPGEILTPRPRPTGPGHDPCLDCRRA